ncbi:MAG TPA: enoyl-CoA hydratase-related protein [Polyangiales bacterium]|nr:enoyl-CoA hydratase-related protein [Polyangiales bacterium]
MSEDQVVTLAHEGPISTLTIQRPAVLNALNVEVLVGIKRAADEVRERVESRVLIVTGAGEKAFVAGADIAAMKAMSAAEARVFAAKGHAAMDAIAELTVPVIAAVNGFALGGGCELALAADFIYASERARFGLPEVNLGLFPGFGGTQRLPRRIAVGVARELVYSGAIIDAAEALRIGLVNRVFPPEQLLAETRKTAELIASKAPLAIQGAKRVINEGLDNALRDANELEREGFERLFESQDSREGMSAFLEKRAAKFRGL